MTTSSSSSSASSPSSSSTPSSSLSPSSTTSSSLLSPSWLGSAGGGNVFEYNGSGDSVCWGNGIDITSSV